MTSKQMSYPEGNTRYLFYNRWIFIIYRLRKANAFGFQQKYGNIFLQIVYDCHF